MTPDSFARNERTAQWTRVLAAGVGVLASVLNILLAAFGRAIQSGVGEPIGLSFGGRLTFFAVLIGLGSIGVVLALLLLKWPRGAGLPLLVIGAITAILSLAVALTGFLPAVGFVPAGIVQMVAGILALAYR